MSFIRQWQITLLILIGVALCFSVLSIMLDSENLGSSLPIMNTIFTIMVVAYLLKRYIEEFVNLDKI